jgi:hypothetical protein
LVVGRTTQGPLARAKPDHRIEWFGVAGIAWTFDLPHPTSS